MAIVYIHRRKDNNEVFYIGISKSNRRAYEMSLRRRNIFWHRISTKYGCLVEITHKDIIWEEACSIEKYLISFYKESCQLTNLTDGGEGTQGYKCNEQQRLKRISYIHSPEMKERQKKSMSRPDVLAKQSIIQTNIYSNPELRKKQSKIQKEIHGTPEMREKNRQRALKQMSTEDARNKVSEGLKRYYQNPNSKDKLGIKTYQYSLEGNLINEFAYAKLAVNNDFKYRGILDSINKNKYYKGFIWKKEKI